MNINLESSDNHSIQAYSDTEIIINSTRYTNNLIISSSEIINEWSIHSIQTLNDNNMTEILQFNPEVIIIGHKKRGLFPPSILLATLAQQRIALEGMSIGAACRTFNVLLNEGRKVVLGLILISDA